MQRLDLTLPTPEENLALDEALLDQVAEDAPDGEFLRLWESPTPMVVVGRSSRIGQEVDEAACGERNIPILRRSSGGAAILAGPGCLMYAVVLSYRLRPELRDISHAHAYVLGRLAKSLQPLVGDLGTVQHAGTSDLVLASRASTKPPLKFSGNSLRAKRTHLLYHGTLLYRCEMPLLSTCLRMPPRQPAYRAARTHADFLTNLPVARPSLIEAIDRAWPTTGEVADWPKDRVAALVAERFSDDSWNSEFR